MEAYFRHSHTYISLLSNSYIFFKDPLYIFCPTSTNWTSPKDSILSEFFKYFHGSEPYVPNKPLYDKETCFFFRKFLTYSGPGFLNTNTFLSEVFVAETSVCALTKQAEIYSGNSKQLLFVIPVCFDVRMWPTVVRLS